MKGRQIKQLISYLQTGYVLREHIALIAMNGGVMTAVKKYDALLLENSLIKNHQPKYNVNLKDDKTFPWILIKNERFPRIFYTRKYIKDGSQYFGPYASVTMMHTLLDLIKEIYKLRN